MTKNNFKSIFFALFAAISIASMPFYAANAEQQVGLTEEQKGRIVKQINENLTSQSQRTSDFQSKFSNFKSKTYTYHLNETEARRKAKNRSDWLDFAKKSNLLAYAGSKIASGGKSLAEQEQEFYDKKLKEFMAKTYNEKYNSFIGWGNGNATSELGWTSDEKATANINKISLDGVNYSNTDLYWDKVISQAAKQAAIELEPEKGAGAAIKAAQELDDLKTQIINNHGSIKGLLSALVPSNYVSVNCTVPVDADGKCPEGKEVYTVTNADGKATTGASKGCVPLPVKYAEIQTCILCPLFEVILGTDQTMATKSFGALASSFRNLVLVVLALFIAYQTLLTVSAFTKQDAPKYITTLLVQAFKVLVVALLLSDSTYIYHYVINPLMKAGLEFGLALLFKADLMSEFNNLTQQYMPGMQSGVIGQDLLASVMAAVKLFNKAAAQMPAIGSSLICISTHAASWKGILPNVSMFIEGLLVYGFGWAIVLASCFYLLDSVVRFGIFCALLPFLIAAWPFKVTAKYTSTGWTIFMNSFFNFVMMGLIISINTELISQALSNGQGGLDALEAAINGSNVEALEDLMDISGVQFLVLVACCMFAFKLVEQVNSLATEIAGGGGSKSIGAKIGSAAAQAAKKVGGVAASGGKALGGAVYEGTGAKASVDNMKDKAMGGLAKAGAKVGLGRNANPSGAGGNKDNSGNNN